MPLANRLLTIDIGRRNRMESYRTCVWPLPQGVTAQLTDSPGQVCMVRIKCEIDLFHTGEKSWNRRRETAWHLFTRQLTAKKANALVRSHWVIENSLQYVRNVAFAEDTCRIRDKPGIFARLRSWTLNVM